MVDLSNVLTLELLFDCGHIHSPTSVICTQRWDVERQHHLTCSAAVPFGGFLTCEPSAFDPEAFRLAANEAALVDPQHRLLLECAAEAVFGAGCAAQYLHCQHCISVAVRAEKHA